MTITLLASAGVLAIGITMWALAPSSRSHNLALLSPLRF
jgi:hypothetical protein